MDNSRIPKKYWMEDFMEEGLLVAAEYKRMEVISRG
jgi:hypothetical protein